MIAVSEPNVRAFSTRRIAPYLHWWSVEDDRIGGAQSDSYAVDTRSGVIFVDPLPMTYVAADSYPAVASALLTAARHQRASWRYRFEHGARVWAPRGSEGYLLHEPDDYYTEGSAFPARFKAIRTPSLGSANFAFLNDDDPERPKALFVGDLIRRRTSESPLELAQNGYSAALVRRDVEELLQLDFDVLCLSHGGPILEGPHDALRELLDRTV